MELNRKGGRDVRIGESEATAARREGNSGTEVFKKWVGKDEKAGLIVSPTA